MAWQVGKGGGQVVRRWQGGDGARVCEVSRWEMWENGEVVGLEVPAFIQVWVTQGES